VAVLYGCGGFADVLAPSSHPGFGVGARVRGDSRRFLLASCLSVRSSGRVLS
jgi:hypothetical protein